MTEYVEVEYDKILFATDDAIRLEIEGEPIWIPRSVIELNDTCDENCLPIAEWFAIREGLV